MSPRQHQYGPVEWHRLAQTRCHEKHGDGRYDPGQWSHLLRYLVPAVIRARWRRLLTLTTAALLVVYWFTHGAFWLTVAVVALTARVVMAAVDDYLRHGPRAE